MIRSSVDCVRLAFPFWPRLLALVLRLPRTELRTQR